MSGLTVVYGSRQIQEFVNLHNSGQLNLEPGFQRKSVWSVRDRQKLIESIFAGCPVPSIFLYRSSDNGRLKYDVIDGKQRLESVLMFQGARRFSRDRFEVTLQLPKDDEPLDTAWKHVRSAGLEHQFMGYSFQTVEVSGELSEIIDLFVRINSTGKRLTSAEKRHARFYHSPFLKVAGKLANKRRDYIRRTGIMSEGQIGRMKHVELVSELLASIVVGAPINKKSALDAVIGGNQVAATALRRAERSFTTTMNRIARILPRLRETRLRNSADFYSLFMYFWKLEQAGAILTDRRRNSQAEQMLIQLSTGVDSVRDQVRKAKGASPDQQMFADYLLTIQGDTDSLATRHRRESILERLLSGIFERKDERRVFSVEQRRMIWHSTVEQKCSRCGKKLGWSNFTLDHRRAHSKGGKTAPENAALMCQSCNSRKGNRGG